ncbi:DUF1515 family protein [Phyllobacterium sp. LjRoot231]|uniref:DUF1515 family protein n=1 Tax=Phyllobacterium sp. LjRoot231 TaxID=3342289 RepID=UPI003ECDE725
MGLLIFRSASGERDPITDQVKDSKKVTDQVKQWRAMGLGGLGVVGIASTALGISLASSIEWISRLFHK